MSLALVKTTQETEPAPKAKVLNADFNERLSALNKAERILRNELGMTVIYKKIDDPYPQIAIQYQPGGMSRVLNRMTGRKQFNDGECVIVSGFFCDVNLLWAVPK